jgi:hypothetical protein
VRAVGCAGDEMASSYSPPAWAAPPTAEWGVDVIKDGVVVESISLTKLAVR